MTARSLRSPPIRSSARRADPTISRAFFSMALAATGLAAAQAERPHAHCCAQYLQTLVAPHATRCASAGCGLSLTAPRRDSYSTRRDLIAHGSRPSASPRVLSRNAQHMVVGFRDRHLTYAFPLVRRGARGEPAGGVLYGAWVWGDGPPGVSHPQAGYMRHVHMHHTVCI